MIGIAFLAIPSFVSAQEPVTIREVEQVIPTYMSGLPDPNPMFFFGKESQGAEGRIYPYPLYDNLTNKLGEKTYQLIYLENEYVKIGILPEIGGRIFSALDKTNNYDFVYNQHVIKPALIGLIGSWISGGIEWNIPHHHRASTFMPVQWSKEEHADGSKTIWVGELEIRQRMRWAVGYTLRPGSSVLECAVRIINRTPLANTMLCFANVAVHTNKDYQVIFPPATQWATGHKKREFFKWPVVDMLDMSFYKNNYKSASWFAVNNQDDFVAGYDHGVNAGTMTIADHHIVPGKKFFTWGVDNMWDKILTDKDGPYLEIMVGAYSDNQPDYSWLQPFEERSFLMSWYPFRGIGGVKNSNLDAAVNLEVKAGKAVLGFYTTHAYKSASVSLRAGDKTLIQESITIDPGKPYTAEITLPVGLDEHDLRASITAGGRELVSYSPVRLVPVPKPVGTLPVGRPQTIKNDEELFLAGQRVDQFHDARLDADLYWEELLKRDSGNVSANTGMGILNLQKAKYTTAEKYFNKALARLTAQYTTPKNAEPLYYLGVALKAQGRLEDAYAAFYKATWSQEWKSPSFFSLAEISSLNGNYAEALNLVNQALDANALNLRAYGLKAALLRKLGRTEEALNLLAYASEKTDPLDVRFMAEKWLATKAGDDYERLVKTLTENQPDAQEVAAEYYDAGLWSDGLAVLETIVLKDGGNTVSPLVYYYLGDFAEKLNEKEPAAAYRHKASLQLPDYVFPFQSEVINVLRRAMLANRKDAKAPYYLGNLLYDWQPEEAFSLWQASAAIDPEFPVTWRNLAIAYAHLPGKDSQIKAIASLEKAVSFKNPYPTHFAELDRLYKAAGTSVTKRLSILEKNEAVVAQNDEALGDMITLKIFTGKADAAIQLLQSRTFSIWEGGSAFNTGLAWADAHLVRGLKFYRAMKYQEAIADFEAALLPPDNLRAEQRFDVHKVALFYWTGCAYAALGEKKKADIAWKNTFALKETEYAGGHDKTGSKTLKANEQLYFQTLAKQKINLTGPSPAAFEEMIKSGAADALAAKKAIGVSGPVAPDTNAAEAHYVAGLGYLGQGQQENARKEFTNALALSPDFLNAQLALDWL
ncbi:Tetratricopeptide repeat-containing protein [Mucilaginibacter gossypiicola]|uniref:Tetratricopeptide repeat-containing protein n=1 Tax=Mucilaginibacter gossypiicola TaxID=551995 RepID=A0A1H8LQU9_9SPHI|nr:DUF5107 domain-containing protein [Mucilaginibacter gossypiicola]SEO07463.1 Tetratricopeptide repeat-containing protein [Mucilaginibacter gossypiicola]